MPRDKSNPKSDGSSKTKPSSPREFFRLLAERLQDEADVNPGHADSPHFRRFARVVELIGDTVEQCGLNGEPE